MNTDMKTASHLCLVLWFCVGVLGMDAGAAGAESAVPPDAARDYFTDVVLIDQEGEERRLYSDLMQDKVVIINVIFTTCQGVCPVTMGNLVKIQGHLGERLGQDVHILSLTVDREVDTPQRLREFANKFEAGPGWYFLTGTPENLDFALRRLGLWVQNKDAHSTLFLVGNVPTGLWKKAYGMAGAGDLVEIVDGVLEDRLPEDGVPEDGQEAADGPAPR